MAADPRWSVDPLGILRPFQKINEVTTILIIILRRYLFFLMGLVSVSPDWNIRPENVVTVSVMFNIITVSPKPKMVFDTCAVSRCLRNG